MALALIAVIGGIFFLGPLGQNLKQGTICDINQCNNAGTVNACKTEYKAGFLSPNQLNQCLNKCSQTNCATGSLNLGFIDPWSYDKNKDCKISETERLLAMDDWAKDIISLTDVLAINDLSIKQTLNPSCGTTTIPAKIDCYKDSDCGTQSIVSRSYCCNTNLLCVNDISTPICYSPGIMSARCGYVMSNTNLITCLNGCGNNQCLTTTTQATTTTVYNPSTTTTTLCVDCGPRPPQDYTMAIIAVVALVIIIYFLKISKK
jgi:hypothetical protein